MPHTRWIAVLVVALTTASTSFSLPANIFKICTRNQIENLNKKLAGTVLDFTANHGKDLRIYSPALCSKRDMYVYLPPGYDGQTPFPLMIWMHGFGQDEKNFLESAPEFDKAIRCGKMPPMIIACPDGSITGSPSLFNAGSFYLNSKSGNYQDYVMVDVWDYLQRHFAIRPERGAHVIAGGSMGGFAAYNLGFKYRERFGTIVGVLPGLSLRYADCRGRYFGPYDPNCVMFREKSRPHMIIGRFNTVILIQEKHMTRALVDDSPHNAMPEIARQNPIEMLDTYAIKPGEFNMFVGYAGRDEFNLDAQAEHFLDYARARGLDVTTAYVPDGDHSTRTGIRLMPNVAAFLSQHVAIYAPGYVAPSAAVPTSPLPIPVPPPGAP